MAWAPSVRKSWVASPFASKAFLLTQKPPPLGGGFVIQSKRMEWLKATYLLRSSAQDIQSRAQALAVEQSIELPPEAVQQPHILQNVLAQVKHIQDNGDGQFAVVVHLSGLTLDGGVSQLLNMLLGNCALQEEVSLLDVELPAQTLSAFAGPRFGVLGLRQTVNVFDRPLTCTALKPQGLVPQQLAQLAHTFALGGIDLIKDDHGLANQAHAPFAQRVLACHQAVQQANRETGGQSCYVPNLQGSPRQLQEQIAIVHGEGIRAVMLEPMLVGLPVFAELVAELGVPVLAHPAFAGQRIAPAWLFGKLYRLLGADAVIFPNFGGRFSYSRQECQLLAHNALQPWGSIKPAMPVPAGGMNLERVPEMLSFYGQEVMLLIGGALLMAQDRLLQASRDFVQRVAEGLA